MSRKNLRVADFPRHVVEAIERIDRYVAGLGLDTFSANEMTQDAVIRNLEIIGEACRNIERIDPAFSTAHPDFPLRAASEMRNVLAHGYFGVDLPLVWKTIRADLPALRRQTEDILSEAERG